MNTENIFINQLRQYARILTRDEIAEKCQLLKNGDKTALEALYWSVASLIPRKARYCLRIDPEQEFEDYISELSIKCIKSIKKYNPDREGSLMTYTGKSMDNYIKALLEEKNKNKAVLSLDSDIDEDDIDKTGGERRLIDKIVVEEKSGLDGSILKEYVEKKVGTDRYKILADVAELERGGFKELARKYNCTRQNIQQKFSVICKELKMDRVILAMAR